MPAPGGAVTRIAIGEVRRTRSEVNRARCLDRSTAGARTPSPASVPSRSIPGMRGAGARSIVSRIAGQLGSAPPSASPVGILCLGVGQTAAAHLSLALLS